MISNDVLALIQLYPPGIELCRVSNIRNEEGATNRSHHSSRNDEPRMDRLCTLLFPPLRQQRDGAGARISMAFVVGEHLAHETFSSEVWTEYHRTPLGRSQIFRQSTRDSVVSVVIGIVGCGRRLCNFEIVVHCDTLLSYADGVHVVPTAAAVGDVNAKQGNENDVVLWDAWGPQATSVTALDSTPMGWRNVFGERRATIEKGDQIRIRDYNSYRIWRAGCSNGSLDQNGTCRIVESGTIRGEEWFEEDVTTMLPYLDILVDVLGCKGCKEIYLEQDEVLLRVDDLPVDRVSGTCRCHRLADDASELHLADGHCQIPTRAERRWICESGLALYSAWSPEYEYDGSPPLDCRYAVTHTVLRGHNKMS